MERIINSALELNIWDIVDINFAKIIATKSEPHLILASACLSANTKLGNICLPLKQLISTAIFKNNPILSTKAWKIIGSPSIEKWNQLLNKSNAVSNGALCTPLVLDMNRLYLHKMWVQENIIVDFFCYKQTTNYEKKGKIIKILNYIFNSKSIKIDWQKIATATAIIKQRIIISGGPGTGKTSTIGKILASLIIADKHKKLRIKMASPTGKAAIHLGKSVNSLIKKYISKKDQTNFLPLESVTIHQMLGAKIHTQKMKYNNKNHLPIDILIIDETSMLDLAMMANLILAIPPQAKTIFVGDHHQLPSINGGSIFKDLCYFLKFKYSSNHQNILKELTGYKIPIINNNINTDNPYNYMADHMCLLQKNYRFKKQSNIAKLANAIKTGNKKITISILNSKNFKDLKYTSINNEDKYLQMLIQLSKVYKQYFSYIKNNKNIKNIFTQFNRHRILCAINEGPFGTNELNKLIEKLLIKYKLINLNTSKLFQNYTGKPIIIKNNDYNIGLVNGNIGIILPDTKKKLKAFFYLEKNILKIVDIERLPKYELSYAMTIHKAQGSEFDKISLILPNNISPILTKELIYSGITRAKNKLTIYATKKIILRSISSNIDRQSGIIEKIKLKTKIN